MDKRKVALFSTNFLENSQSFVFEEVVNHKRYQVDVFAKKRKNEKRFPFESVNSHFPSKNISEFISGCIYNAFTYSQKFLDILKNGKYSLIHAQFGPGSIYALYYARKLKIPLVITYGGYDVPVLLTKRRFNPKYWRYTLFSGMMLKTASLFLPVSKDLADKLVELGAPAEKVKVFHRGIVIPESLKEKKRGPNDSLKVIMIGRFVEKKGFEYGIRAVAESVKEGRKVDLIIVGSGPLKAVYESLIAELLMEEHIKILGNMPQKDVFKEMERCDVVMVPSVVAKNGDTEGITNVLKEGCARGLVALITDHGGNPEIVEEGVTGFIVPERDVQSIKEKLILLCDNPGFVENMGIAATKKMKNELDIKITNEILEKHYDEVVKKHNILK
jgi:colanic acid/amylovoran biosynthesis glycosyltransferase